MKKIISAVINVLVVAFLVVAAVVLVTVGVNKKAGRPTTVMGYSFMAVQTGSMTPTYPVGTVIVVKGFEASQLNEGDVISFYSPDPQLNEMVVTHRIQKVIKSGENVSSFVTKGDANVIEDKYEVSAEKVIGKVVGTSNVLATLSKVRENPTIFFFAIMLPMCAIIVYEFVGVTKKVKSGGKEEKTNDEQKLK